MAATASIPVYLSIGSGSPVAIGSIELAVDSRGVFTLTSFDVAAALREAADAVEAAAREAEQQNTTADDREVDDAAP
jgi:20S proteasome alpha/beta subunit